MSPTIKGMMSFRCRTEVGTGIVVPAPGDGIRREQFGKCAMIATWGVALPTLQLGLRTCRLALYLLVPFLATSGIARADGPTALDLQNKFAAGSTPTSGVFDATARSLAAQALNLASGAIQAGDGSASAALTFATGAPVGRSLAARAADTTNVADFGATADLAYMYGPFAMAAGGNHLLTDSYRFGSSVPGQVIIIPGAGPNGAALITKIVAIEPIGRKDVTVADVASTQIGDPSSGTSIQNSPLITVETGTDNTAAINSAISFAEKKVSNSASNLLYSANLFFPPGEYMVSSINLTGINAAGFSLYGPGAHIHGFGAGNVVVDALGAGFLRWDDVEIDGDLFANPKIGLQVGRNGTTTQVSAGGHSFDHLTTSGNFTEAAVLNENSETTTWTSPRIYNGAANAYGYIADGSNHFNVSSTFINTTIPVESGQSFDENLFLNPIFMSSGVGSTPLWISNAARMRIVSGYIANTDKTSAFRVAAILFQTNGTTISQLDFDVHSEAYINSVFTLSAGPGISSFDMEGFRYRENGVFSSSSIFTIDPASSIKLVTFENLDLDVAKAVNAGSRLFDTPASYTGSGRIYLPAGMTGLPNPGSFSGPLCMGVLCDSSGETVVPTGSRTGQSLAAIAELATSALPASVPVSTQSAGYTITASDCNSVVRDLGSVGHVYTVPMGLPTGCKVDVVQAGTGAVGFTAGNGEMLEQRGQGNLNHTISGQFGHATVLIDSPTSFVLTGDVI